MNRSVRTVLPALVGIVLFALLAALNESRGFTLWRNYALSGILLAAPVAYLLWRLDLRVPHYIQWSMVVGLLLHYGGGSMGSPDLYRMGLLGMHGVNGAYHTFWFWDHLTHFVGIGAGAMGIAYLLEVYQVRRGLGWGKPVLWLFTMTAALAAGVAVELYEYLGKAVFQTIDQGGYVNTMHDLHFNVLGALVGTTLAVHVNRKYCLRRLHERWPDAPARRPQGPARFPAPMFGLWALMAVPAVTSLYLAIEFFFVDAPPDLPVYEPGVDNLYEPALRALTASAVAGLLAWPVATLAWSALLRRHNATAPAPVEGD